MRQHNFYEPKIITIRCWDGRAQLGLWKTRKNSFGACVPIPHRKKCSREVPLNENFSLPRTGSHDAQSEFAYGETFMNTLLNVLSSFPGFNCRRWACFLQTFSSSIWDFIYSNNSMIHRCGFFEPFLLIASCLALIFTQRNFSVYIIFLELLGDSSALKPASEGIVSKYPKKINMITYSPVKLACALSLLRAALSPSLTRFRSPSSSYLAKVLFDSRTEVEGSATMR